MMKMNLIKKRETRKGLLNLVVFIFISLGISGCKKDLIYFPGTVEEEVKKVVNDTFDGTIVYVDVAGSGKTYCAGWHDRDKKIKAYPGALFKIGSISKLYIAAAATKLITENKLSLNQTLHELVPDLARGIAYSHQITVKMLLQHRSGIPDYSDHPDYPWTSPYKDKNETYQLVLGAKASFKPNKEYQYSNTNYLLLGEILDRTLGYGHHQYISEKILRPLNLNNTYHLFSEVNPDEVMSGYFIGYAYDIKYNDFVQPGGSMVATAEDLGVFIRALNKKKLFNPHEQAIYNSVYELSHTGLLPGYQSIARYYPEIDAVVVQFVNTSGEGYKYWNKFERRFHRVLKALEKEIEN